MSLFNFRLQALNLQETLKQFWRINAPLTFVGVFTFGLLLLMLPGLLLDERVKGLPKNKLSQKNQ